MTDQREPIDPATEAIVREVVRLVLDAVAAAQPVCADCGARIVSPLPDPDRPKVPVPGIV